MINEIQKNERLGKSRLLNYVFAYPLILDSSTRIIESILPIQYAESLKAIRHTGEDLYKVGLCASGGLLLASLPFFGSTIYRGLIDCLGEDKK